MTDLEACLSDAEKRRARTVGYVLTFLTTFSLGVTEIFAPWYAGILGASQFEMGWAMGSFGIVYMFSPILGGKISDRIGRKTSLIAATVSYIAVLALYPQPFIMPFHLIIIRALEGFFFGIFYPTIEALVTELCPDSQGAVLGNFSTSWSAGMVFSPGVIAFMALSFGNVASIYVVIAVELLCLGLIVGLVKTYTLDQIQASKKQKANVPYPIPEELHDGSKRDVRTTPRFFAAYSAVALFGFASTLLLALFPTYIQGMPFYGPQDFAYLLMVWNIARTAAFLVCTRIPHGKMDMVMITGTFVILLGMTTIYMSLDMTLLTIAMILCGVGVGFNYLGGLYTVVSATEDEKGAYAGIAESLAGVGFFVGPILGGYVAEIAADLPYLLTAIYALLTLVVMIVLLSRKSGE
jgi:MFS family permease